MSLNNVLGLAHLATYKSRVDVSINDVVSGPHFVVYFIL
jgi:hypothetical protein